MRYTSFLISAFLFLTPVYALSAAETEKSEKSPVGRYLNDIQVHGNTRTKAYVILRELEFKKGDLLTEALIAESKRRLLNLRIFTSVDFSYQFLTQKKSGKKFVNLTITVQERWTTLPILKAGDAGGTQFYTIGVYDINFLGRYLEIGAQYESLNGEPAGVTWFRNPRLFGERLLFGYDLWFINRNRELFDQAGSIDSTAAFSLEKNRYHFFLKKELAWWLELGIGLDLLQEEVNQDNLDDEQRAQNAQVGFDPTDESEQLFLEFTLRLGRLNFDNYLIEGFQTDIEFKTAQEGLLTDQSESRWTIQSRNFWKLPHLQNIGLNLKIGQTDTTLLQNEFFVGGLSEVRGFEDGQFRGNAFWQANAEYRVPSWTSPNFVLQHVFFYDVGNAGEKFSELFDETEESFHSLGTGVRLISPKVFRFNLRMDIAKTFGREGDSAFSIGLQQFF